MNYNYRKAEADWILYKIKMKLHCLSVALRSEEFAKAYKEWQANTMNDADFVRIARKHIRCPDLSTPPAPVIGKARK